MEVKIAKELGSREKTDSINVSREKWKEEEDIFERTVKKWSR